MISYRGWVNFLVVCSESVVDIFSVIVISRGS